MNTHDAPRMQSLTLNSASFIAQFGLSMIGLALVYHLRAAFGLSPQMVGISVSIPTFSYFVFCIVLGPVCTRFKPRHCVEISAIGMTLSVIAILYSTQVWQVYIALACYGLFMSFLWPQIMAWLSRGKEEKELGRATGSFNFSWSLGAAISPLVTGFLVERSTELPLFVAIGFLLAVFALILMATMLQPSIRAAKSEQQNTSEETRKDHSTPLRFLCWAGVLTVYASLAVLQTIFPMYAQDTLMYSESRVGILLLARGFATCLAFVYMRNSTWWHFKRSGAILMQACAALSYFALSRLNGQSAFGLYLFVFLCFGIFFSSVYSMSIFHGVSGSVNRSKRMLVHEILLTTGTIAGSSLGGTVYEYFGFSNVALWCTVLVAVPVVISIVRTYAFRSARTKYGH
ncbi:MAG: MFS transporter [Spirochaetales bacterium]|nr:MFS transporter [Spirochaetales bacterium]